MDVHDNTAAESIAPEENNNVRVFVYIHETTLLTISISILTDVKSAMTHFINKVNEHCNSCDYTHYCDNTEGICYEVTEEENDDPDCPNNVCPNYTELALCDGGLYFECEHCGLDGMEGIPTKFSMIPYNLDMSNPENEITIYL